MIRIIFLTTLTFILFTTPVAYAFDDMTVEQRYVGIFELNEYDQFKTVQNLTPYRRRTLDIKEIEAEIEIELSPYGQIEIEAEFEHGGTGSTIEFDNFEEFGEFESEVEKGGEVAIKNAFYNRDVTDSFSIIFGLAPLYLSLNSAQADPTTNSAFIPSNLEGRMIPKSWSETGLQTISKFSDLTLRTGIVSGLNSEFFRKYNWIGGGHQKQFEKMNIEDIAGYISLEYGYALGGKGLAISYYRGNTRSNRYKKDKLNLDAHVSLTTAMGSWTAGPLMIVAEALRGDLENSEAVSIANSTLGGLAKPKNFASLGAKALLDVVQLRYNVTDHFSLFGQWEHVNTFVESEGSIYSDPRYDIRQSGLGFMQTFDEIFFLKGQYYRETTELEALPGTENYVVQVGFDTGEF
jgi:hypothetical protein